MIDNFTTEEMDYVVVVLKKSPERLEGFQPDAIYMDALEEALDT